MSSETSGQPPRPEDFPLGSPESTRSSGARLDAWDRHRIEVISHIPRPGSVPGPFPSDWNKAPRFGESRDCGDVLFRVVYHPRN